MGAMEVGTTKADAKDGLRAYYKAKIEEFEIAVRDKTQNLRRLEAQRNELNTKGEWRERFFFFFFFFFLSWLPTTCPLTARKDGDGPRTTHGREPSCSYETIV